MRRLLRITGHYIHEWLMESVIICFKGKRGAENIRHKSEETVSSGEIYEKILPCLICNNAASIVKASYFAFSDFQEQHNKY